MKKIFLLALCVMACTGPSTQEHRTQRVQEIDRELSELNRQLHENRKTELNDEIEGQAGMLGEYKEFTTKVSEAEKIEQTDRQISKRISELQTEKQKLLETK